MPWHGNNAKHARLETPRATATLTVVAHESLWPASAGAQLPNCCFVGDDVLAAWAASIDNAAGGGGGLPREAHVFARTHAQYLCRAHARGGVPPLSIAARGKPGGGKVYTKGLQSGVQ